MVSLHWRTHTYPLCIKTICFLKCVHLNVLTDCVPFPDILQQDLLQHGIFMAGNYAGYSRASHKGASGLRTTSLNFGQL